MDAVSIVMEEAANDACPRGTTGDRTAATSRAKVFAIPTDEEYMIALDTQKIANA
jgi:acetate kinase